MRKQTKAEKQEAITWLKEILKPGDTIHAIMRSLDRQSGATQWDFVKLYQRGAKIDRWDITYNVHQVLGYRLSRANHLCLPYMNMDPAFQVVYSLARVIFMDRVKPGMDAGYMLMKETL